MIWFQLAKVRLTGDDALAQIGQRQSRSRRATAPTGVGSVFL